MPRTTQINRYRNVGIMAHIDAGKIRNDLGWSPNESFETGIRKTIHWYLDNQNWWKAIQDNNYRQDRLGVI